MTTKQGYYGKYGGMFVPELLIAPLTELTRFWKEQRESAAFHQELEDLLSSFAGRPTPITMARNFAAAIDGPNIYLKREDLLHSGAHKINNSIGQCLLAKKMGKTKVIAETGAGQHGVATATAAAHLQLQCKIFMGRHDMQRQYPNVQRMKLLGAEVIAVDAGDATLKEAVNEALREYAASIDDTHYCIGSALGPSPYPEMVEHFQSVIGNETSEFFAAKDPDFIIASVGGGSNAIGIFAPYLTKTSVQLIGVEAGGKSNKLGEHAARFNGGRAGVIHGFHSILLQDDQGNVSPTSSISAGLDYPAIGPHHAYLHEIKRVSYVSVSDADALKAMKLLCRTEGIIPALESSHALAYVMNNAKLLPKESSVVINLSGRGDKDLAVFEREKI
jgi:tryptophan synthase beta subunit